MLDNQTKSNARVNGATQTLISNSGAIDRVERNAIGWYSLYRATSAPFLGWDPTDTVVNVNAEGSAPIVPTYDFISDDQIDVFLFEAAGYGPIDGTFSIEIRSVT